MTVQPLPATRTRNFYLVVVFIVCVLFVTTSACTTGAQQTLDEPVRVAFESPLNLIVVDVEIEGKGPFRFFLDSGATATVVDTELAHELGLDLTRSHTRRGTAPNSRVTAASVRGGLTFELSPAFKPHIDHVITAPFTRTADVMLDGSYHGILGSGLFFDYVVEVDYVSRTVAFESPVGYEYLGRGTELALEFPAETPKLPAVRASLFNDNNRLLDYVVYIDSGGQTMGTVSVAERAQWDGLVTRNNKIIDALAVTGLSNDPKGTTYEAFTTKMDRFVVGPFEFVEPMVGYSDGGAPYGSLGASILRRFKTTYDYHRKSLFLEPNQHLHDPFLVDQSGMMITASSDGAFDLLFVAKNTPASEANLRVGDRIVEIDGVETTRIPLNKARRMFGASAKYQLVVERGNTRLERELLTRPLFQ